MNPALRVMFWIVVAASLLANAIVLGLLLRFGDVRGVINGGGGGFAGLPADIRQDVRDVLRDNRSALRGPMRELGRARRAMFDAAAARPYDRAAVSAAMARVRAASASVQAAGQDLLLLAFDRAAE